MKFIWDNFFSSDICFERGEVQKNFVSKCVFYHCIPMGSIIPILKQKSLYLNIDGVLCHNYFAISNHSRMEIVSLVHRQDRRGREEQLRRLGINYSTLQHNSCLGQLAKNNDT